MVIASKLVMIAFSSVLYNSLLENMSSFQAANPKVQLAALKDPGILISYKARTGNKKGMASTIA